MRFSALLYLCVFTLCTLVASADDHTYAPLTTNDDPQYQALITSIQSNDVQAVIETFRSRITEDSCTPQEIDEVAQYLITQQNNLNHTIHECNRQVHIMRFNIATILKKLQDMDIRDEQTVSDETFDQSFKAVQDENNVRAFIQFLNNTQSLTQEQYEHTRSYIHRSSDLYQQRLDFIERLRPQIEVKKTHLMRLKELLDSVSRKEHACLQAGMYTTCPCWWFYNLLSKN